MKQVISLKDAMDKITLQDLKNLKTAKQDKTVSKYLECIKNGRFTFSDIRGFLRLLNCRFETEVRKTQVKSLMDVSMDNVHFEYVSGGTQVELYHFKKPMKIERYQTTLGKAWLKQHFFKTNGQPRSGRNTENVSERVLNISKSVSRFEFIGVGLVQNQFGDTNQVIPIYRTYNRKGEYFDYCPIHWCQPLIFEGL